MQSLPTTTAADERSDSAALSVALLRAVLDGRTYDAAASEFGLSRTAVERRIKSLAWRLFREVGVGGMNEGSVGFVQRLRTHRDDVVAALEQFERARLEGRVLHPAPHLSDIEHVFSDNEIADAARRIRARSPRPWRDLALFYLLLATGARPTEVAGLRVGDYLAPDGAVRHVSEMPAEASFNGRARPLYFASSRLIESLDRYLEERIRRGQGTLDSSRYRGLDSASRLFLTYSGEAFRVTHAEGSKPSCRPIHDSYRKLFRMAELDGSTPSSMRRTVVARLYRRGADEEQVGLVLGISDRGAVRELFPRVKREIVELVEELV